MPERSPFDIRREDRHAGAAERFGDDLQGDGLAGAGSSGDQAMTVGKRGQQHEVGFGIGLFCDQHRLGHVFDLSVGNVSSKLKVHRRCAELHPHYPPNLASV